MMTYNAYPEPMMNNNGISLPKYSVPKTKEDLDELLFRYQQLKRERSEQEQSTIVENLDIEIKSIEKILYKVSEIQNRYMEEEKKFYEVLKRSYEGVEREEEASSEASSEKSESSSNESSTSNESSIDLSLLDKQIAALQILSKDLDLPESFQQEFANSHSSEDYSTEEILPRDLFNSMNFEQRAELLGISLPNSSGVENPIYAPLGNFYTEQGISTKIANRIRELEQLPANLGTFNTDTVDYLINKKQSLDELKIQTLIELKSLRVLAKQKQIRKNIIFGTAAKAHYDVEHLKEFPITMSAQRSMYIRPKIIQPDSHRLAAKLEERRELEAKRLEHALHVQKVNQILLSSESIINNKWNRSNKRNSIGRSINNFHSFTEKEESKKLEKTARQRLQALKANDEEAYIKLLDQTKDHRITHLLKQTNSFLDSLAQAVKVQQVEQGAEVPVEKVVGGGEEEEISEDNVDELREKIDYYQVAHRIQEEIKVQPSILVGGQLKEYQIKGLQWMVSLYNNKLNGILADEMGLGKTIQSISLVTYLIEKKNESKFLVIVPLSTITNWTMEFEKWAPSVNVIVYKGSQQQRRSMQNDIRIGNFQVILTTYEYIIRERPILAKFHYSHMIIDEGHRMKNASSKLSITLKNYYRTKNRLILTGTPLQNNLPELWALLNFVLPKVFNSVKSFDEWFNTPFANTGSQEKIELTEEESLLVIRRLHKVLRPFLLRRLKKDVEKDLPDKVEKVVKCKLSGLQYVLYQQMLKHNALFVGQDVGAAKSGIKGLNNKIMQLRKICNHPFVFEEVEAVLNSTKLTNDLIWRVSGKFELLDRVLPKFKMSGHRVLMFFQMTQVMDIMEDFLRWRDMKYLRLDGGTKAEDRQDMLKVFNAPNSDYFCFLLSTRAGGLGLNLQTADTVIIFDTDWNPHQDLQAQDRAHRIGQKNEVRILRLITNDSVEEVILERAHQKLDIDGKVIQAGKFDNKSTAEEQEQFLKKLLEAEANKDQSEENDALDDEELNDILARSEDEKIMFNKWDAERMATEKIESRSGGYKNRLITRDELPQVFKEDITHHFEKDTKELARMREKKKVKYDDGLTEEQWLMAMDDDDDTVEDAIRRKEERASKRRRAMNGGDDDEEGDDNEEGNGKVPKKRARRSRTPQTFGEEEEEDLDGEVDKSDGDENDIQERGSAIIEELCNLKAESDGHNISDIFLDLPAKKHYPDYYQIIKNPVSINQLKRKLKQDKIESIDQLLDELRTMCTNAKTYNEEGSWVYVDAETVEEFLDTKI
ncbi:nuclear protein Sth1p/NPS1 [[Candida] anglica]